MNLSYIVNNDGQAVPVKVVNGSSGSGGGFSGKNIDNDEYINEVSFEVDADGYPVLRIIDAAPYAYDSVDESYITKINKFPKLDRHKIDITINGGQTSSVSSSEVSFGNFDVSEYKSISWGVFADSSHDFELITVTRDFEDNEVLHRPDRSSSPYREDITGSINAQTFPIEITTTGISLLIQNKDNINHDYSVYIYLRR